MKKQIQIVSLYILCSQTTFIKYRK